MARPPPPTPELTWGRVPYDKMVFITSWTGFFFCLAVLAAAIAASLGSPVMIIDPRGLLPGRPLVSAAIDVMDMSMSGFAKTIFWVNISIATFAAVRGCLTPNKKRAKNGRGQGSAVMRDAQGNVVDFVASGH